MIYVECKPDFTLVKSITNILKREIIHEGGKSEVCKRLERQKNCRGLIDEDPQSIQPPYVKKMIAKDDLSKLELKILQDNNDNYLIVLCPRLEEWILKSAKEADIDVRRYNLPNNARKLHREININLDKFKILIADLKDCNRMKTLKRLLESKKK